MAQLALEREKQLLELDAMWRKTAASEELRALGASKAALDQDLGKRVHAQMEQERILALEVEELRRRVREREIVERDDGKENEGGMYTDAQVGLGLSASFALVLIHA